MNEPIRLNVIWFYLSDGKNSSMACVQYVVSNYITNDDIIGVLNQNYYVYGVYAAVGDFVNGFVINIIEDHEGV